MNSLVTIFLVVLLCLNVVVESQFQVSSTVVNPSYSSYNSAVGDLNGDGRLDIVNYSPALGSSVLMIQLANSPAGTTYASSTVPTFNGGYNPSYLNLVDINNDGKLDAVYASNGLTYTGCGLIVHRGNGAGGFSTAQVIVLNNAKTAVSGDFNKDGYVDFLVATNANLSPNSNALFLCLNNAGTSFGCNQIFPNAQYTAGITGLAYFPVGDFNRDGNLDFIIGSASTIKVYLGNGQGGFIPSTIVTFAGYSSLYVGDVDGDYDLDLGFTYNNGQTGGVQIYLNNGNAVFTAGVSISSGSSIYLYLSMADVNYDGLSDLFVQTGTVLAYSLATGSGNFNPFTTSVSSSNYATLVDINNDEKFEAVTIQYGTNINNLISTNSFKGPVILSGGCNSGVVNQQFVCTFYIQTKPLVVAPTPTGTITLYNQNNSPLGSCSPSGSPLLCLFTPVLSTAGTFSFSATYSGDSNFNGVTTSFAVVITTSIQSSVQSQPFVKTCQQSTNQKSKAYGTTTC